MPKNSQRTQWTQRGLETPGISGVLCLLFHSGVIFCFLFLFLSILGMGWGAAFWGRWVGSTGGAAHPHQPREEVLGPPKCPWLCSAHSWSDSELCPRLRSSPNPWPHGAPSASRVNSSHTAFEKIISPGSGVRKIVTSLETAAAHPLLGTDVGFTLANLIFWLKKQILCNFWS